MIRPTGARPAPGTTEILELLDRALGGGIVIASGRAPVLVSHAPAATGARFVVAAFETYLQHSDPTGETDVAALLHGVASALTEALGAVRGRIELGLNVVWDRDKVLSELEGDQAAIRRLKKRSLTRQGFDLLPPVCSSGGWWKKRWRRARRS